MDTDPTRLTLDPDAPGLTVVDRLYRRQERMRLLLTARGFERIRANELMDHLSIPVLSVLLADHPEATVEELEIILRPPEYDETEIVVASIRSLQPTEEAETHAETQDPTEAEGGPEAEA